MKVVATRDWSFLRRPRWIVGHVVVLVAMLVFVNMGLWQLRRLADRQDFNEILTSRSSQPPRPLDEVIAEFGPDPDDLELRTVSVVGQYVAGEEVILRARSYQGLSGHHVLTPVDLGDGRSVLIDRGWVPIDLDEPGSTEFAAPTGPVTVEGVLRKSELRGSFGPVDPAEGVLRQIARPDLERLDKQTDGDLLTVYVQLTAQSPAPGELPRVVPLPEPSEGPHRGYAVQWLLFTAVVAIGYPILLRRTAESPTESVGETETVERSPKS